MFGVVKLYPTQLIGMFSDFHIPNPSSNHLEDYKAMQNLPMRSKKSLVAEKDMCYPKEERRLDF